MWKVEDERDQDALALLFCSQLLSLPLLARILVCDEGTAQAEMEKWVARLIERGMQTVRDRRRPYAREHRLYDEAKTLCKRLRGRAASSDGRTVYGRRLWRISDRATGRRGRREIKLEMAIMAALPESEKAGGDG